MLTFREAIADVGEIRKKSHAKVGYQDHPNGNMQCSSCAMFSLPSNCSLVDPPIQPSGWCWEYTKRSTSDMARQELARKNQPGAAGVHTTTALGNEDPKKPKAKNFLSFIAEIKGGGQIIQPPAPISKKKKEGLAKLRIVRHGATRMNNDVDTSADRIRGWMDVPLTKEGRDQAKEAGEALKDHDIEVLVASDLDRAKETADIIGDIIGVKPIYTTRLRPWDLGKFTGMSTKEAIPKMAEYVHEKYDQPVPEGESWEDFAKRAFAGIAEAFRKADGKNLAIVTHHRVERLLAGWDEADQPSDHSIDLKEFLKKGDPPGGVKTMTIDLKALNGKGGNEMGKVWDSNDELPDSVQGLPDEAKTVFRRVANDRMKNGAGDVSAIRQAWTAVKNGWKKQGEEWVRKFAGDEESLEAFIEQQQEALAKADHNVNAALVLYPVSGGGQVARTPFPYDQNFFSNLEDEEKPLFLEMLTTQDEFPVKTVQLGSLVTLQDRVDPDHVQANVDDPPDELPLIVRVNGRNVIADGNHRLTAMYVEGYKTATVRYADMNELKRQREGTAAKSFNEVMKQSRAVKAFSPDQPRDDHGRWSGGGVLSEKIAVSDLQFRESDQNRTEAVKEMWGTDTSEWPPIATIKEDDGSHTILDGHNRAAVAADLGEETLRASTISRSQYQELSNAGFDDMEIAYAVHSAAGHDDAASALDQQFRGARVSERGTEAENLLYKRFRAVKACPECGAKAGAWHKKGCSGHVLGDVEGLGKAASDNEERDEHGRWTSGGGGAEGGSHVAEPGNQPTYVDESDAQQMAYDTETAFEEASQDLTSGAVEEARQALNDAGDAQEEHANNEPDDPTSKEYETWDNERIKLGEKSAKAMSDLRDALAVHISNMHEMLAQMDRNLAQHHQEYDLGGETRQKRDKELEIAIEITKTDEDQQLVFGWASVSSVGGEDVVDKQGDIILEDELEKAAYDFVLYCRKQGDMHERVGVGRLVESIVFTKQKQDALNIDLGMVGWFVGFKVDDPGVWKKIKDGSLPEFSIGGKAIREPVDAA